MRPTCNRTRKVLFSHDELTLNMGVLQDLTVTKSGPAADASAGDVGGADGGRRFCGIDCLLADVSMGAFMIPCSITRGS